MKKEDLDIMFSSLANYPVLAVLLSAQNENNFKWVSNSCRFPKRILEAVLPSESFPEFLVFT